MTSRAPAKRSSARSTKLQTGGAAAPPKDTPLAGREGESGSGRWDRSLSVTERKREQRARILLATTHVVGTQGLAHSTVQHVVDEAKISRRSFYEHFADLSAAVLALHVEHGPLAFEVVESAANAQVDPIERLRAGITAFLTLVAHNEHLARILLVEVRALGPELTLRHEAIVQRFAAFLYEGGTRAFAAGAIGRAPEELTVFALVSAIEAVALRYVSRKQASRAVEAAEPLFELALRALR